MTQSAWWPGDGDEHAADAGSTISTFSGRAEGFIGQTAPRPRAGKDARARSPSPASPYLPTVGSGAGGFQIRTFSVLAVAGAMLLVFAPVSASHCTTYSTSENDADTVVVYNPALNWYHIWDNCQPECLFSYWLYEESNGIPGLQRGDYVVDDTCHWMIESDTMIY